MLSDQQQTVSTMRVVKQSEQSRVKIWLCLNMSKLAGKLSKVVFPFSLN